MKHIKTPVASVAFISYGNAIKDAEGRLLFLPMGHRVDETGEIVQAVNAHDALLAACKMALRELQLTRPTILSTVDALSAAIEKAEGESGAQ